MPAIEREGVTLYYATWGDEDAPAVVLLHGFTSDHRVWRELGNVLEHDFFVVAPDLRGHGHSDAPEILDLYSMEIYANDLRAILDHLEVAAATIVGSSFGGMVALQFATTWPERVSLLVLTDTSPAYDRPEYDERFRERERRIRQMEDVVRRFGMEVAAKRVSQGIRDEFLRESLRQRYLTMSREGYLGAAKARRERPDLVGVLRERLTMPVLLCAGEDDPVYSALDVMAKELPEARVVTFRECGHGVPFIKPNAFSAALGQFFGDAQAGNRIAGRSRK